MKPHRDRTQPLAVIADDNELNRTLYGEFLVFHGFDVVVAADGYQAVKKVLALLPDILVLDLTMPIMDGWNVARRLRSDPRVSSIPIIAVSGHVFRGSERAALAAGCDAFLPKPCLPDPLLGAIERLLPPVTNKLRRRKSDHP